MRKRESSAAGLIGRNGSWVEALEPRRLFSVSAIAHPVITAARDLPAIHRAVVSTQQAYLHAIRAVRQAYRLPGVVVGISGAGGDSWTTALGWSDLASRTPISTDEYFPIRSITKSFVVTLVLQLARDGQLSLDDPIGKYVPGIPNGDTITLTQLAAMESGVQSYTRVTRFLNEFSENLQREWTPQELLDLSIPGSPLFKPGKRYDYSNTNTILLGMVAEQATHMPLGQSLQQFIFTPLGLTHTSYPDGVDFAQPHPSGYEVDPETGNVVKLAPANFSGFGASGAMVTTVDDLLTWGRALGTGTLIGPDLQQFRMDHSRRATDGPDYHFYGLGMGELKKWWGHTGEGLGFQAATFYDPKSGTTIAILVNSSQPVNAATEVFKALANVIRRKADG